METNAVIAITKYIKENMHTPFDWGQFDCCIFASHCIFIQTDIDLYEPYRDRYDTEIGAKRALTKFGSIESQLDKHFERINPNLAQRGDVHMLADGVMAVQFGGLKFATSENGVKPTEVESELCWRVE